MRLREMNTANASRCVRGQEDSAETAAGLNKTGFKCFLRVVLERRHCSFEHPTREANMQLAVPLPLHP